MVKIMPKVANIDILQHLVNPGINPSPKNFQASSSLLR